MADLTPEELAAQQAAAQARGGGVEQQALLGQGAAADPAIHNMMVHGYISRDGNNYVDDSGNFLEGAPDENGMMALPLYADGTYAGKPQSYNLGPDYAPTDARFTGTPLAPQVGGFDGAPAAAGAVNYDSSSNLPLNWRDFSTPTNTTTGGGFFSMDDNFAARGQVLPHAFQSGSSQPSTNNWRLLPPTYQKPNYIMRNGQIINMKNASMPEVDPNWVHGGGGMGFPTMISPNRNFQMYGWPGQLGNWMSVNSGSSDS